MRKLEKVTYLLIFVLGLALCLFANTYASAVENGLLEEMHELYAGDIQQGELEIKEIAKVYLNILEVMPDNSAIIEQIWKLRLYLASEIIFWIGAACVAVTSVMIFGVAVHGKSYQRTARFDTKRIALCGVLLSLMLILGWVERQIPLPQGVKLGLSNSVLIFAVYMLDIPTAFVLMIYKVFLSNLLFGNLGTTFMMGFAGGSLSLLMMVLISRIKGIHPITVSIVGGVFHNVGQVLMAIMLMQNAALLTSLPWLILAGVFFGALTGICADRVMKHLKHMRF